MRMGRSPVYAAVSPLVTAHTLSWRIETSLFRIMALPCLATSEHKIAHSKRARCGRLQIGTEGGCSELQPAEPVSKLLAAHNRLGRGAPDFCLLTAACVSDRHGSASTLGAKLGLAERPRRVSASASSRTTAIPGAAATSIAAAYVSRAF